MRTCALATSLRAVWSCASKSARMDSRAARSCDRVKHSVGSHSVGIKVLYERQFSRCAARLTVHDKMPKWQLCSWLVRCDAVRFCAVMCETVSSAAYCDSTNPSSTCSGGAPLPPPLPLSIIQCH